MIRKNPKPNNNFFCGNLLTIKIPVVPYNADYISHGILYSLYKIPNFLNIVL